MDLSVPDLKKDVQCSLCNDTLAEPKMLPCFHTFCKLCITRNAELIEGVNVFQRCPECETEISLPQPSSMEFEDLKPSLLHSRLINILTFLESERACYVSGSHSCASYLCFDCDRSLCDECAKNHSVFTKDHQVVSISETKVEDIKVMLNRENNCEKHIDKTVEFFCKDCEQVICIECLKHDHDDHSTIALEKYTSAKKALLSQQLELLKECKEEMEKKFQTMKEVNENFKHSCEKAKQEIKERLDEVMQLLQNNAQDLVHHIGENIKKAEINEIKVQSVLGQTQGAIDYMAKLIDKGIASEIIHTKDMECLANNCSIAEQIQQKQHLEITFGLNDSLMEQVESGLGTLELREIQKTDHTMSTVEVDGELEAMKKTKLVMVTKTEANNPSYNPSDIIDVKIIPQENVKKEEKYVRSDGKIEIEFMAKVAGQLTAEVKVNGNHVSNSPLVMNVKPHPILMINLLNELYSRLRSK